MSEGVCEAPTFMEWSTMVVPTYPEGGSHALQVCQHHHQVVRVGHGVKNRAKPCILSQKKTTVVFLNKLLTQTRQKPSPPVRGRATHLLGRGERARTKKGQKPTASRHTCDRALWHMVRAAQASPDHGFCGVSARAGDPSCLELR